MVPAARRGGGFRHALEYWRIVNKRKWVIASIRGVLVLDLANADGDASTATARLQIDRNVAKVVEGGNVTPGRGGFRASAHAV
jgi:hypothetical protein